jgi:imidazolonepropionase-like amidohydrolase
VWYWEVRWRCKGEQHEPNDHPRLPGLGRQRQGCFSADLLIEGGRIRTVSRNRGQLDGADAEVIEAGGMTVMPGLVQGHAHLSFGNAVASTDLGDLPPEEHTLLTAQNAKALLDHGFTSAYSAASAKLRLDIVIRNAIAAGQIRARGSKPADPRLR